MKAKGLFSFFKDFFYFSVYFFYIICCSDITVHKGMHLLKARTLIILCIYSIYQFEHKKIM